MKFSNKTYDVLKELTTVWLPALGTLYFALSGIWGFPYGEQIVGTITAVVAFLGTCLHLSSKEYNKVEPMDVEGMPYIDDEEIEGIEAEDE